MGLLIDGQWHDRWYDTGESGGRFVRSAAQCRNWVTADGSPGPSGEGGFKAEPGRYHLYVSLACPWAHRTLIFRKLKGLEAMIGVSVVHWLMAEHGWTFEPAPGATGDTLYGHRYLHELYARALPHYTGRVTVPVLWDQERRTIVNNESSEIIRMLNSAFDGIGATPGDYYPAALRAEIDQVNERVYATRQQRCLPRRVRDHPGGLRRGGHRAVRHARLARGAAGPPALSDGRPDHRGRLAPVHHARCASTRSITATSSATCAGWSTTRICGPTRASSTSGRASPRPSTSRTSRATTTPAMAPSTRPASCPWGRSSTLRCPTAARRCRRPPGCLAAAPARRLRARRATGPRCRRCRCRLTPDPASLVGTWRCRDLNPYPGQARAGDRHHLRQ